MVDLHLRSWRVEQKGVDVAFFFLDMEFEVEAVCEEVLIHGVEIVDIVRAVGLCFDVVAVGVEPVRAADDLTHGYAVHEADHELDRDVLRCVAVAAWERFDAAVAVGLFGETNGRYVEGEAGGIVLCVRERCGDDGDKDRRQDTARCRKEGMFHFACPAVWRMS